jgi:hypothetical protein
VQTVLLLPEPCERYFLFEHLQIFVGGFNTIEQAVEAHVTNGHRLIAALEEEERKVLTQLLRKLLISFEE